MKNINHYKYVIISLMLSSILFGIFITLAFINFNNTSYFWFYSYVAILSIGIIIPTTMVLFNYNKNNMKTYILDIETKTVLKDITFLQPHPNVNDSIILNDNNFIVKNVMFLYDEDKIYVIVKQLS